MGGAFTLGLFSLQSLADFALLTLVILPLATSLFGGLAFELLLAKELLLFPLTLFFCLLPLALLCLLLLLLSGQSLGFAALGLFSLALQTSIFLGTLQLLLSLALLLVFLALGLLDRKSVV